MGEPGTVRHLGPAWGPHRGGLRSAPPGQEFAAGQRRQSRTPEILAIGEAKHTAHARSSADLARLEQLRDLIAQRHHSRPERLLLFSAAGFDDDLVAAAATRDDVELVDLERIRYGE